MTLTTHQVRCRLRSKFEGKVGPHSRTMPAHVVAFEVPIDGRERFHLDGVGPVRRSRQRIDAVAVGIWAKTEHLVHGFEIKVSRGDLLAELRDPTKAEAGVAACDTWSLVLGDPALLRDSDEVPAGWGILVPAAHGLTYLRQREAS